MYNTPNANDAPVTHDAILRALVDRAVRRAVQDFESQLHALALAAIGLSPVRCARELSDAELNTLTVAPESLKDLPAERSTLMMGAMRDAADRACLEVSSTYRDLAKKLVSATPSSVRPSAAVLRVARAVNRQAARRAA